MGIESFNQFNSKKEHKPDGVQLNLDFDASQNNIEINKKDSTEEIINLEKDILKNREGSEGEYKLLTEEELEVIKKENPAEYVAIMSASKNHEHEVMQEKEPKKEIKELPTEFALEEELAAEKEIEKQMEEKDDPGYEYFGRFNKDIEKPVLKKAEDKDNINREKTKSKHYSHYKNRHHGGHNINGPIMPFDPLK